jgi:Ca-activated chloride channel family protein
MSTLLTLGLLLAAVRPAAPQAPPPVFGAGIEVVRVDVAVSRGGTPVEGLAARDFALIEDGIPQPIDAVLEEYDVPLDVTLVLDLSQSVAGARLEGLRRAALRLIEGLRDDDRAGLVVFSHQVCLLQPLTADLDRGRRAIAAAAGTGSTSLRDAVYAALALAVPGQRRSAVLVFSDGVDNASWLSSSAVEEAARRSATVVYGVVARPARRDRPTAQEFVSRIADLTGGRVWEAEDDDLQETFAELLEHIRGRYLLTYTPSPSSGEGWHELEVRLVGRSGDVLARPGYHRQSVPR